MREVFEAAFQPVNLPYTIIMIVLLIYWLIAILGLIDMGLFDLGLDVDGGVDAGGDVDVPMLHSIAGFFNVGDVPIMFWISVVALSAWVVSMQVNHFVDAGQYQSWLAIGLAVPNVIFGMFVAKLVILPFKNLAKHKVQETKLVGTTCEVISLEVNESTGQCEVRTGGAPITLSVCTAGGERLQKGDAAVIVERDKKSNLYTVTKYRAEEP